MILWGGVKGAFGDFSFLPSQLPEQVDRALPYYFNMSSKEIPLFTQSGSLRKREPTEQDPGSSLGVAGPSQVDHVPLEALTLRFCRQLFPAAPVTLLWHQGEALLSGP